MLLLRLQSYDGLEKKLGMMLILPQRKSVDLLLRFKNGKKVLNTPHYLKLEKLRKFIRDPWQSFTYQNPQEILIRFGIFVNYLKVTHRITVQNFRSWFDG